MGCFFTVSNAQISALCRNSSLALHTEFISFGWSAVVAFLINYQYFVDIETCYHGFIAERSLCQYLMGSVEDALN